MNTAKALSTILSWTLAIFPTLGVGQRAREERAWVNRMSGEERSGWHGEASWICPSKHVCGINTLIFHKK